MFRSNKDGAPVQRKPAATGLPAELRPRQAMPLTATSPTSPAMRDTAMPAGVRSVEQAPSPPKLLIVGASISLSGEITACDRLVVEGTAQVTLNQTRSIEIAESGRFTGGRADVEDAVIAGLYEGELTVRGRLLIRATGQVSGTVRYGELEVERGGRLTGTVAKRESDTQADTQGSHGSSRNIASLPMQRATDSEEEHRHDAIAVGGLGEGE